MMETLLIFIVSKDKIIVRGAPWRPGLGLHQLYGDEDHGDHEEDDEERYEDPLPVPGLGGESNEFLEQQIRVEFISEKYFNTFPSFQTIWKCIPIPGKEN